VSTIFLCVTAILLLASWRVAPARRIRFGAGVQEWELDD